jgi:hypothetical protein
VFGPDPEPDVAAFAYIAVPGSMRCAVAVVLVLVLVLALILVLKAMVQDYDPHLTMKYVAVVADIYQPPLHSQYILDRTLTFAM